jgi:hypothetical protein
MPELLDGFDGSIEDEKASNVGKGDSHTYGHTRDTSIFS